MKTTFWQGTDHNEDNVLARTHMKYSNHYDNFAKRD